MKTRVLVLLAALLTSPVLAQKKEEKPKVHGDFQFGSYPTSRDGMQLMSTEKARIVLVSYAEGWSFDKVAKTFKMSVSDVSKEADKLEEERFAGRQDEYGDVKPSMPIIRERDWDRVKDGLQKHTQEFTQVVQSHWPEMEAMVATLEGSKSLPRERVMYETVVSGILFGGMLDAFYEDKTLIPPPPRRGKNGNDRFYAWLVESNPDAAGKLKRELRESDGYRIISIGTQLPEERLDADDLRGKATVYDDADAIKYRRFIGVFTRDKLLPYFKSHRQEFLNQAKLMSSGHYVAAAEVLAWYYNLMANGVVDNLAAARRITAPEKYYTYAIRIPQQ
jgi:hypothetical protein